MAAVQTISGRSSKKTSGKAAQDSSVFFALRFPTAPSPNWSWLLCWSFLVLSVHYMKRLLANAVVNPRYSEARTIYPEERMLPAIRRFFYPAVYFAFVVFFLSSSLLLQAQQPNAVSEELVTNRTNDLLKQMTLDEKIAQLSQ